ncbi:RNase adapter RapZ [Celerinatantimonas yamalensis]|uniref:RNase adapter RapZ n=1 Tax=Celerinatantimonas yamalensis TaxID=559956 RepID=A0ABW9GAE6_9GAMM
MDFFIVSGRSGSGKTVALRVLEDLGFYCVDNLPLGLLPLLPATLAGHYLNAAVSIDVRNLPSDPKQLQAIIAKFREQVKLTSLFVDADDATLIRRYSETRRIHPLNKQHYSLAEAISAESMLLEPLSCHADLRINTSQLSIHQLRELLNERVMGKPNQQLALVFESFGFKNGLPPDADYVFDVRFLPNPHWHDELRPYTGLDAPVQHFFGQQPEVRELIWQLESLLSSWLPHLERNNRAYVTVAVGCTGGKHRSVYVTEQLSDFFSNQYHVQTHHLNLPKVEAAADEN